MFQLSRVAYQSLSRGLATGRVKVPRINNFNNTLKELKGDVKNVSKKLSEVETELKGEIKGVQEDVKGLSKKLSENSKKLNEIGTKLDMHVKYLPVQTTGYVCGALVGGTSFLTAIGWGFTLEKKDSAESVGWVRNLPKSVPKK
ncbi:uncharacterized protein OCT59_007582 [Rhizophagus irregularis]|uniref:DUF1664 domain-containing protein n=3 Tax=Rhizophagus irregularis TaxID=588596 RepID=U9U1Z4_RHIID|nr:hypothetical protein GLOIN_2v1839707 [Rhizophagus irregularis DAOM 181602=DAOM 197198]EXX77154.1 hypothetical protein RirG_026480 [Rhizophagus irregularis DAOM 197198w]PKY18726.1 hypothetical protein RhiirB3_492250 [Rhizophagus irregularis]POG73736.1 hypothetical protein GLOIN_2v1839707 [Rhizophagus irregularis DAOM 181602=DAOM 197198]UZO16193.1 hypothetical protein OCT59_007582 [Rhizophagus irregularis]CAB5322487.1 unnamed protein product [Rhizophagus irregularis]|eukprot:XP_025180602.1 hypothetical protein GLOIN_2v1839707 [Rhizophagus irregularis DAOM 181602=DAOM 197198]